MNLKQYFFLSFLIGTVLGHFLFGGVGASFAQVPTQAAYFTESITTQVAPSLYFNTEQIVSLMTAGLLFASAYVIWNKYRVTTHDYSAHKTHWRTL